MQNPKILIGTITAGSYAYCLDRFLKRINELIYTNKTLYIVDNSKDNAYYEKLKKMNVNVIKDAYIENPKERLAHSRNILRDLCLQEKFDYLLSLEQDIIPPKDAINRLLRHNKEIITGIYYKQLNLRYEKENEIVKRQQAVMPVLFNFAPPELGDKMRFFFPQEVEGEKLLKVRACGLGCILIHRTVLEKIKFRVNVQEADSFDDLWFCDDVYKQGLEIYADTSVKCQHLILEKQKNVFKSV